MQHLTLPVAPLEGNKPERLGHLHNFRGLAIAFIVATHCISAFDWSQAPQLEFVLKRLMANGTVFFVFIAGYLFEHLALRYRPSSYLAARGKFVLLPYLCVSALPIAIIIWNGSRPGLAPEIFQLPSWQQVLYLVTTGAHVAPFWFIPTIAIFYLASPLLHRVFRPDRSFALLPLLLVLSMLVPRGLYHPLQSFVHFLSIWVLGMACCRFRAQLDPWLDRRIGVLVLFVVVMMALDLYAAEGSHSSYSLLGKVALSVLLLVLLRHAGPVADRSLALMGSMSFGIFFLHSYLITAAKFIVQRLSGGLPAGGIGGFLLAVLLACLASAGLARLIQRALGARSRFLIGV